jgi:peptidoglycan/LPS O-acetylase OafA/YrhL
LRRATRDNTPRAGWRSSTRSAGWGVVFATTIVLLAPAPIPVFANPGRLGALTAVGVVSYSLYLVQQPFLLLTATLVRPLHASPLATYAIGMAAAAPLMIAIAYAMYRLVERPFMRSR